MDAKSCEKVAEKFSCQKCHYYTDKKSSIDKHFTTIKHNRTEQNNIIVNNNNIKKLKCKNCNKTYMVRNSLWYHEQKCINKLNDKNDKNENVVFVQDASTNEMKVLTNLVLEIVKSNTELQKHSQELQKQNNDLQKQMIDVCKNIQPASLSVINNNNNTTNSHNKTFNLQFFLNEQCKYAMNIKDFVKSIKIEMSDLERIGKEGYVEGISKIILEKLKQTDIYKRPLHCSDAKRETMYIKENDVWNKDESLNNEKMIQFIKDVDCKNYDFLLAYGKEYPEVYQHDSKRNTPYLHMVLQSTRNDERINKVVKRIIKEVVINKDI